MIGMTCSRQQHPSTSSLCQTLPTPDWYLESKPRRLLGKKKNLVPAKRKRSKLSYLNGRRVSLDDSGRLTVDRISIAPQISGYLVPGKRLPHLLHGPLLGGVFGHLEVHYTPSLMRQDDENKQHPEGGGGNREKVDRGHLPYMIPQEGSPSLGGRSSASQQIFGDRRLRDLDSQLEQFSVNAGCSPQGLGWLMRRIRSRISRPSSGLPGARRDFRAQYQTKARRCQRRTVAG